MLEMEKRKAKKLLKEKLRTKKSAMFTSQPLESLEIARDLVLSEPDSEWK